MKKKNGIIHNDLSAIEQELSKLYRPKVLETTMLGLHNGAAINLYFDQKISFNAKELELLFEQFKREHKENSLFIEFIDIVFMELGTRDIIDIFTYEN